ncbi:phosphonate C-P lyase system protein PhnH [Roseovarius aquimarinus]|uniref:Phosphonate C-P lyase system protein PhnH n=1 Tax=Roseovarius aquimarinus TaxID=1229156 RepID=A0ABW7I6G8_9RHOB
MQTAALKGGFADPARDAAHAFRALMQAMARPGRIEAIAGAEGPAPMSPAAACALAVLCDPDTPVHLAPSRDSAAIRDWITFHTGAPLCAPEEAVFALGTWAELRDLPFAIGSAQYPDRSATLIVEIETLEAKGASLSGPGIDGRAALSLPEIEAFARNRALFPMGVDHYFTSAGRIAGLPRSTRVSAQSEVA